jgi:beta-mannosidase
VISADKVARGVFLSLDGTDNFFSDNCFDLIPGAKKQVYVKTDLNEDDFRKKLKITILNNI